jgi:glycosyltransferase involved in cell wall biosynthesis
LITKYGEDILIADKPSDFCDHVVNVLNNEKLARDLGESGYKKAESRFTWEKTFEALSQAYNLTLS